MEVGDPVGEWKQGTEVRGLYDADWDIALRIITLVKGARTPGKRPSALLTHSSPGNGRNDLFTHGWWGQNSGLRLHNCVNPCIYMYTHMR